MDPELRLRLFLSLCLFTLGGLPAGSAQACELEETKFGYRSIGDCLIKELINPVSPKQPNLVPIDASAVGTRRIDIEATWKNTGTAGTEGLVSIQFIGQDGNTYGPTGEFNVTTRVTVTDQQGNQITTADINGYQDVFHFFRYRSNRMNAGDSIRDLVGTIFLPDNTRNYDICMEVRVDSNHPAGPGGEVWESNEGDNYGRMHNRIFPGIDPDPKDDVHFEDPYHGESLCFE